MANKLRKVPVPKAKVDYKKKSSRWRAGRGDNYSYKVKGQPSHPDEPQRR